MACACATECEAAIRGVPSFDRAMCRGAEAARDATWRGVAACRADATCRAAEVLRPEELRPTDMLRAPEKP